MDNPNLLFIPKLLLSGWVFIHVITIAFAQIPESPDRDGPYRTAVIEPFHIIDNVYYVGTTLHNSSYLFTTDEGHILMDTTWERMAPGIAANIEKLGFNPRDVKYMLSTHAHHDHVGGHIYMKELTGATVVSSADDARVIETGGEADFRYGDPELLYWHASKVDQIIEDGGQISLGGTVLTAHLTPGHTKGCTTWTTRVENMGKQMDLLILCGLRMDPRGPLIGNEKYPEMARDFAYTFALLKTLPVDVFLGAHGYWFGLEDKMNRLNLEYFNPFIDPDGYRRAIFGWEEEFLKRLRLER